MNKNNIWSSVLQEQVLCEEISKFSVQTTSVGNVVERDVESYDLKTNTNDNDWKRSPNLRKNANKKNGFGKSPKKNLNLLKEATSLTKLPVSERINLQVTYDESKSREHIQANEFDSDEIVCRAIVYHLREKNSELIGFNDFLSFG
jgi:hypothetical protein